MEKVPRVVKFMENCIGKFDEKIFQEDSSGIGGMLHRCLGWQAKSAREVCEPGMEHGLPPLSVEAFAHETGGIRYDDLSSFRGNGRSWADLSLEVADQ